MLPAAPPSPGGVLEGGESQGRGTLPQEEPSVGPGSAASHGLLSSSLILFLICTMGVGLCLAALSRGLNAITWEWPGRCLARTRCSLKGFPPSEFHGDCTPT